jgi:predicted methyltransferase
MSLSNKFLFSFVTRCSLGALLLTSGAATGAEANVAAALAHSDRPNADAADNSIDRVTWILGPYELGFVPDGASMGDPAGAGSSDLLKNPTDPLTAGVFDPSIRGETSQFVVLYRK